MAEPFTDKQIEQARRIFELLKETGWKWEPKVGDWYFTPAWGGEIQLCTSRPNNLKDCFPLLTWARCRKLLREMGWCLIKFRDTCDNRADIRMEKWIRKKCQVGVIHKTAPNDLSAIYKVLIEALERLARQSQGGGGKRKGLGECRVCKCFRSIRRKQQADKTAAAAKEEEDGSGPYTND